ncbi:MAG: VOC family protein [Candidatus Latescibacterota bacterium]
MRIDPYLSFDGQCRAAFEFYAKCLGGKIEAMMPFAGSPAAGDVPEDQRNWILHARLSLGDQDLMGSDAPHGRYSRPQGVHVTLRIEDPAEAERVFRALSEGGTVSMPLGGTFWAQRFGMCVDRFGIPWMVNCERPD